MSLDTYAENTWCPGCGNFGLLMSVKNAINELVQEGIPKDNFVIGSGIGCHAKIVDYINVNSFYSIHGRTPPVLTGMKLANKNLVAIGFSGDGDGFDEGVAHLVHAAKRNTDITMIIHNNRVFALTTGQFTATSPKGFHGRSTPEGSIEDPLNPIKLMLTSGATFVARAYVGKGDHLKEMIKQAVKHRGFSFIEVLQPCVTFNNTFPEYNKKVYIMDNHDTSDFYAAMKKAEEWDEKIPVGIFYQKQAQVFEDHF